MSFKSLLSIDPSLTCSGWALFSVARKELLAVGKIRSLPPEVALASRLRDLQEKISHIYDSLELGVGDVVICEAPTTMRDPKAALKVEQVRGMFETVARSRLINVPGRLNPRSVQHEILGLKGKQLARPIVKDVAVNVVQALFGRTLERMRFSTEIPHLKKNQDIVDAILIGNLALTRLEAAAYSSVPIEELFMTRSKVRVGKQLVR